MHLLAVALGVCMLVQPPAGSDPFRPRVVPSKSPPVAIEPESTEPRSAVGAADPSVEPTLPAQGGLPAGLNPAEEAAGGPNPSAHGADSANAGAEAPGGAAAPIGAFDDPQAAEAATDAQLAPVGSVPRQRLRPPELLAEALASPREAGLEGEALQLVAALSRASDRQQQLEIARAYWSLSAAQANYHWARHQRELLDRYAQPQDGSPLVASARSAAAARVRDAQLGVARSQQQLADLLRWGGDALPLAVDRPHVGSYNTLFEQIFGDRSAPARIRLIHRTLPLRRQVIDARGAAILAALDAVEATGEQLGQTGDGLATLLAMLEQLHNQRQTFMDAVRQYNGDIAEYLFAVARPGTSEDVLVSRLILTSARPTTRPDLAPPRKKEAATSGDGGTPEGDGADASPTDDLSGSAPRTSFLQPSEAEDWLAGGGLYGGLAELHPPARVQKLAGLLHWDRSLPEALGQRALLAECLRGVPTGGRMELLAAYWQARESAARYQALNDQRDQLDAIAPVIIALRHEPGVAEAGVRFEAARRAATASVAEAHTALVESQFALTQRAGRRLEEPWLMPATPPQSGRYVVGDHDANDLSRRATAVSLRHAELEQRAEAVIRADELRASLGSDRGEAGQTHAQAFATLGELSALDDVVWAIAHETNETLDFLRNLTRYNLAIARYALATSPEWISSDELVRKLVVARLADGET